MGPTKIGFAGEAIFAMLLMLFLIVSTIVSMYNDNRNKEHLRQDINLTVR